MDRENKRRLFLKQLFSLLAFSAGSVLSYKGDRGFGIGISGQINMDLSDAWAKAAGARVKKMRVKSTELDWMMTKDLRPWTRPVLICR